MKEPESPDLTSDSSSKRAPVLPTSAPKFPSPGAHKPPAPRAGLDGVREALQRLRYDRPRPTTPAVTEDAQPAPQPSRATTATQPDSTTTTDATTPTETLDDVNLAEAEAIFARAAQKKRPAQATEPPALPTTSKSRFAEPTADQEFDSDTADIEAMFAKAAQTLRAGRNHEHPNNTADKAADTVPPASEQPSTPTSKEALSDTAASSTVAIATASPSSTSTVTPEISPREALSQAKRAAERAAAAALAAQDDDIFARAAKAAKAARAAQNAATPNSTPTSSQATLEAERAEAAAQAAKEAFARAKAALKNRPGTANAANAPARVSAPVQTPAAPTQTPAAPTQAPNTEESQAPTPDVSASTSPAAASEVAPSSTSQDPFDDSNLLVDYEALEKEEATGSAFTFEDELSPEEQAMRFRDKPDPFEDESYASGISTDRAEALLAHVRQRLQG